MPEMSFSLDVAIACMFTGFFIGFGIITTYMMIEKFFGNKHN